MWSSALLNRIATLTGDDMLRRSILAVLLVLFVNLADADTASARRYTR